MSEDNFLKVKMTARQISFLMSHQRIMPDLKEAIDQLSPDASTLINRNSPEYLLGASEALEALILALEEKGF